MNYQNSSKESTLLEHLKKESFHIVHKRKFLVVENILSVNKFIVCFYPKATFHFLQTLTCSLSGKHSQLWMNKISSMNFLQIDILFTLNSERTPNISCLSPNIIPKGDILIALEFPPIKIREKIRRLARDLRLS